MKKLLALLLVIMAAISLASCGDDTSDDNDREEEKLYSASYTAYINQSRYQSNDLPSSDKGSTDDSMLNTYTRILVSNSVLSATAEAVGSDHSIDELKSMVKAEVVEDTELIRVIVFADDPEDAYSIASAHAKTAPKYITEIVEGCSMKIVDYPVYKE